MAAQAGRGELPWRSKSSFVRKRSLNADRITDGAVEVLDLHGVEGLSMRRLGAHLGSGATSLYWHVPNKDALLDLIVDRLMGEANEAARPEPGATWQDELAAYAVALRAVLVKHPGAALLLAARAPMGPQGRRFIESMLGVLGAAGFDADRRALAYAALSSYTIGQVLLAGRDAPTDQTDAGAFDYGLQRLLDGLEVEIGRVNPSRPA